MQRKSHFLKNNRRGIAMIMAIAAIVVLGTLMAMMLSMSADTDKRTLDNYLHEQAMLLTRSATEYALLEISGSNLCNPTSTPVTALNAVYPATGATKMFDISITIRYIGLNCIGNGIANADYIANINTPPSTGAVLMDVIVTDANLTSEPIRYHRRTLQKL